jgi:Uma2 family endonuclease
MEAVQTRISMEDYLEMEYASMERHEYVDGKIRTMPYASENHRHLCHNINRILGNFYLEREENVFTNQTLVFFKECERGYYPDATVFPSEIEYRDYRGKMKAALNPLVVIEVLSESTEHIDRGEKWLCYQTIPSLRQYVLVSQEAMIVETYSREGSGEEWVYKSFEGENAEVPIGECKISMKEIYRKVVFAERKTDEITD